MYRRLRLSLWARLFVGAFVVALSSPLAAQGETARAPSGIGVYLGLIYEASRFDGGLAHVLEGESGRIGVMFSRWSVGYVGKSITASSVRIVRPGDIRSDLHIQGVEVGYLVTNRRRVQPVVFVTIGRGEVNAQEIRIGPPYAPTNSASGRVIEPSVGIGVALGPIFRLDGRAGMRFGSAVHIGTDEYALAGAVASATVSFGWMSPWRTRRAD